MTSQEKAGVKINERGLAHLEADLTLIREAKVYYDNNRSVDAYMLKSLFSLFNYYYDKQEYGLYCSSCRAKTFKGLMFIMPNIEAKIIELYG